MTTAGRTYALIAPSAVLILVAVADAVREGAWDFSPCWRRCCSCRPRRWRGAHARRPVVSLRGDLHRWLTDRASATGEPLAAAAQDGPP
ncbi:hypothetical protein [Planobispora longispora]|uniref:Uncharacterized protein n=1 Tax=Planobispora longispora TaxID=28887 RepID=A0A8J3W688_9ACTN|nr:hypothetical protein [Planobispora longispora]GIH78244.1 hypothetical protein Plo01_46730 [Planobispora longispora]